MLRFPANQCMLGVWLLVSFPLFSQSGSLATPLPSLYRNSLYVHAGLLGENNSYGFHLERILSPSWRAPFVGKFSAGRAADATDFSWYVQGEMGFIAGRGALHFAVHLGYTFFINRQFVDTNFFPNSASAELRYQKPMGNYLFRLGIGYPEMFFLGAGYCFGE